MMIRSSSRGKGIEAKQEDEANENTKATTPASTSSSRQWSAFRNPRIVRVSRSFGGKDRHSKVCTIRGLRDRRIRLSAPTAIQLYDLQDRLGLAQPSKVIDWLLDATKDDIDSLPPLQMPQCFGQLHPQLLLPHHESLNPSPHIQSSLSPFSDMNLHHHHHSLGIKMNARGNFDEMVRSKPNWEAETEAEGSFRGSTHQEINGKGKLIRPNDEENDRNGLSLSAQKLFPLASTNSSMHSFFHINNPPNMALNPYNWDASNLSLSQFGIVPQPEISNSLSLNTGSQFFFRPPPVTLPSFFPQYPPFSTPQLENNESREISHFQLLNSGIGNSQRNNSGRQPYEDQNPDP